MKKVDEMFRPEVVMFVHSYQNKLFSQESSLKEIKEIDDTNLYVIAYRIEEKLDEERNDG
jgi:hypothetical protein